jgi:hypothetical protein
MQSPGCDHEGSAPYSQGGSASLDEILEAIAADVLLTQ